MLTVVSSIHLSHRREAHEIDGRKKTKTFHEFHCRKRRILIRFSFHSWGVLRNTKEEWMIFVLPSMPKIALFLLCHHSNYFFLLREEKKILSFLPSSKFFLCSFFYCKTFHIFFLFWSDLRKDSFVLCVGISRYCLLSYLK